MKGWCLSQWCLRSSVGSCESPTSPLSSQFMLYRRLGENDDDENSQPAVLFLAWQHWHPAAHGSHIFGPWFVVTCWHVWNIELSIVQTTWSILLRISSRHFPKIHSYLSLINNQQKKLIKVYNIRVLYKDLSVSITTNKSSFQKESCILIILHNNSESMPDDVAGLVLHETRRRCRSCSSWKPAPATTAMCMHAFLFTEFLLLNTVIMKRCFSTCSVKSFHFIAL